MSDYLEQKVLDYVLRDQADWAPASVHLSLHTANPGEDGTGTEVSGSGYARQAITFNAAHATNGTIDNSSEETFTNMPGVTVTHIGIWDNSSGGNLLFYGAVDTPKTVTAGDTITLAAGALDITLA
ncbi:MAG: hypothetical protein CMA89_04810 [Euryarchaeota archaeon]|nr:hypothetical protein [Euryarchaeota archaeon]